MFDYYASDAYARRVASEPARPAAAQIAGAAALCRMLGSARPFFRQVFVDPMALVDPSGRRLQDAIRRLQIVLRRPGADRQPFVAFIGALFSAYQRPPGARGGQAGAGAARGIEPELLRLYTEHELRRAAAMTMDELATEALGQRCAA